MKQTPEGGVKAAILEYLTLSGHRFFRMNSGKVKVRGGYMQLSPTGTADFLVCLSHRMPAWVEVKVDGQPTDKARKDAQAEFAEDMKELGHAYRICKNVEEVAAFLGEIASNKV